MHCLRRDLAVCLAFCAVLFLHTPSLEASLDSGDPPRGIVLLSSEIGHETPVEEIRSFVRACQIEAVVIDYAWITYHWDQTDSQTVAALIEGLRQDGVDVAAMYRPRTLEPNILGIKYAMDENGQIAPDHNELCFADEGSKRWAAAWGTRMLQVFPSLDKVIIYNLRPACFCPQCRERGADYYNAQFLAFCRSEWQRVRPNAQVGHAGIGMEYAEQVDFFCPFLSVNREGSAPYDPTREIAALVAMKANSGGKSVVPLANIYWADATNNGTQDIVSAIEKCEQASLGYLLWYYRWIFHSDDLRYDVQSLIEALGGNWPDVSRWYTLNPPESWSYFESMESSAGQRPQLSLQLTTGEQTVAAANDTVLISYLPDGSFWALPQLAISMNDTNRVLLFFQLPTLDPAAPINKAELVLDMKNSAMPIVYPFDLVVHVVTASWDENNTSWNNSPPLPASPSVTQQIGLPPAIVRIDVTDIARQWFAGTRTNYGLLLKVAGAQNSEPDLPFPPTETSLEALPWPHQRPGLTGAEIDQLNRDVWVINDMPLYQSDEAGSWRYFHGGLDIVLDNGTGIHAMKEGWVKAIRDSSILIADAQGTSPSFGWEYTHLGNHQVHVGDFVTRGAFIGEVDFPTGLPHIHLGKIYSAGPYWGEWHYLCMPNGHFTYVDAEAPVIQRPFHFVRNNSDTVIPADAGGSVTLSGQVDIVVGIREPGLYARSKENGYGDRLAPARIEYLIAPVHSARRHVFRSFDFRKLRIKMSLNALDYNTEQTKCVYKHWALFETSRPNWDKVFSYFIITNCPGDQAPATLSPGDQDFSWNTTALDARGEPIFPDDQYDIAVIAYDYAGNRLMETMRVNVVNGLRRNKATYWRRFR